jgi:outer membrane lipoprotein-sorting protein
MKRIILFLLGGIFTSNLYSQNEANDIIKKVDYILAPGTFTGEMTMQTCQSNGKEMKYEMKIYYKSTDSVLVEVLSPEIEKGRKILRIKNQVWMYLPSVKKTIQVSQKDDVLGSDFSNYDITSLSLLNDYHSSIDSIFDGNYHLTLKAVNKTINYDMINCVVNKIDFMPVKNDFYTISKKKLKTLTFSQIQKYDNGMRRPSVFTMENCLVKNKKTVLTYNSFNYKAKINNGLFNKNSFSDF